MPVYWAGPRRDSEYELTRTVRRAAARAGRARRQAAAPLLPFREPPDKRYFAFPNADLQVEVFDPDRGEARRLVLAGEIRRLQ